MSGEVSVFSVSSVLSLTFAQAVAMRQRAAGRRCVLVMWSQHGDGSVYAAMERIRVPGLWERTLRLPAVVTDCFRAQYLPLRRGGLFRWPSRLAEAARSLREFRAGLGEFSELFVCSSNAVDLGLFELCPAGTRLCYIEDGLQAYFGDHYTSAAGGADPAECLLGVLRRGMLRLAGAPPRALTARGLFPDVFPWAEVQAMYPEHVKAAPPQAARISLRDCLTPDAVAALCAAVPAFRLPEEPVATLYLTRPDSEDGLCSREFELEQAALFLRAIRDEQGAGTVWVKRHPRDSRDKIRELLRRCSFARELELDCPYPVELIAGRLGLRRVYSVWTASLVYLQVLFGIETYSFLPCLAREQGPAGRVFARILDEVQQPFRDTIHWIGPGPVGGGEAPRK